MIIIATIIIKIIIINKYNTDQGSTRPTANEIRHCIGGYCAACIKVRLIKFADCQFFLTSVHSGSRVLSMCSVLWSVPGMCKTCTIRNIITNKMHFPTRMTVRAFLSFLSKIQRRAEYIFLLQNI